MLAPATGDPRDGRVSNWVRGPIHPIARFVLRITDVEREHYSVGMSEDPCLERFLLLIKIRGRGIRRHPSVYYLLIGDLREDPLELLLSGSI